MPERMRMTEVRIAQRFRERAGDDKWKWFARRTRAAQIRRVKNKAALVPSIFLVTQLAIAVAQGPAPSPLVSRAPIVPPTPTLPELSLPHDLTKPDLEVFLDGLIPANLQSCDIAGAVVAVVKNNEVLMAKGYGYADFAAKKPVVAEKTLFRPGSISKVFTAIAVMQLVEQGKLDLDRDVNEYLDFAIPKTYPEPVTLRRLLTHTAGFEETLKNHFVPSMREMRPMRDYLIAAMPARIFAPGTVPSYSNYGVTLAGYIVERISGEPFEKYIEAHLLAPLKMDQSTFAEPLPERLEPDMSQGYFAATQGPRNFELSPASPAGGLSASGSDMTRLMRALLAEGTLEGATILKPESVRAMEARQFELHPALLGLGLILMDYSMNGQRIVGHGGDTIYFHSDMMLMPDAGVGLYISYNSAGSRSGRRASVIRAFLNRYFPGPVTATPVIDLKTAQADGRAVSGVYTWSRREESTLLKAEAILDQSSVTADENGILTIEGLQSRRGGLAKWREVGPMVYREEDGPNLIAFRRDPSGIVTELLPPLPVQMAHRVSGFRSKEVLIPLVSASLGLIVLTMVLWPVAVIVRKRYARPLFSTTSDRVVYLLSRVVCLAEILFVVLLYVPYSQVGQNVSYVGDGINPWLNAAHIFGWAAVLGLAVLLFAAVRFWRLSGLGWWARVHASLLFIASASFLTIAWWTHLLSPSLRF